MADTTYHRGHMAPKMEDQEMGLKDLLIQKMRVLYDVEQQIIKALPKMAKSATDKALKQGFEDHLKETAAQAGKLERVFEKLGEKPKALESEAMKGMVADAEWVIKNVPEGAALDANLAAAAQYVEHYEIAGYGSAAAWAREVGHQDVADILDEILDEEKATDEKLTELAETKLNAAANDLHKRQ